MKVIFVMMALILVFTNSQAQNNSSVEGINNLSFKILEQVYNEKENCFYSPFSLFTALSMTYAGAKENTKLEMEQVLELTEKEKVHQHLFELSNVPETERGFMFLVSNSLYVQKSLKIEKPYSKTIQQQYSAKVENTDFADEKDREKTRLQINKTVQEQTKNNIRDFIPKGVLDQSTTMILINAVYFNAIWNTQFPSDSIKTNAFYTSVNDSVECQMMNLLLETKYYEDKQMQVVELPYLDKKAALMFFLPKQGEHINPQTFNYEYIKKIATSMNFREVKLSIPKFKLETNYELSECFKNMGMKSSFEAGADFSGISGSKGLFLNKILHKSVLDVSEKGTEAASSTAIISMRSAKIAEPASFIANRPFYFLIKQNQNRMILFMGYLANPSINGNIPKP